MGTYVVVSRARRGHKTVHVKFEDMFEAKEAVVRDLMVYGAHQRYADYFASRMFTLAHNKQGRAALKTLTATYALTIEEQEAVEASD